MIHYVCGMNDSADYKARRIDYYVALPPADLLCPAVTVESPFSAVFTDCESMMAADG